LVPCSGLAVAAMVAVGEVVSVATDASAEIKPPEPAIA
jgi:hypothetical protein